MARFYSFFDQLLFFFCTGMTMQIFNQKNNICTLVVQNIGYFCKKLELLDWQSSNISHMQMKPRPKKDQKTIFLSAEQFIVKTQFEISKYLLWIFMSSNICRSRLFNSSPKLWRSKGEKEKKAVIWTAAAAVFRIKYVSGHIDFWEAGSLKWANVVISVRGIDLVI